MADELLSSGQCVGSRPLARAKRRVSAASFLLLGPVLAGCADDSKVLGGTEQYVRASYLEEQGRPSDARIAYERSIAASLDPREKRKSLSALADLTESTGAPAGSQSVADLRQSAALLGDRRSLNEVARRQYDENIRPSRFAELVPYYDKSAREQSNTTALLMGRLTEEGEFGQNPKTSTVDWYTLAANRGSNKATKELVVYYARAGEDSQALAWIGRLSGEEKSNMYLSLAKDFLDAGDELPRNGTSAVRWYRRGLAANPTAAVSSANRFLTDAPTDADRAAILAAVRTQADRGNPDAALLVARSLDRDSAEVNPEAVRYFLIAAKAGNADAMGSLVKSAAFLKSDDPLSGQIVSGLTSMGERGNVDAMLTLGNSYGIGGIVPRDPARSFAWYERAAKAGNAEAQYRTGVAYADGIGTTKNIEQARRWLQESARRGFNLAAPALQRLN